MGTCGHDTSCRFGERLLVHVEEHCANGLRTVLMLTLRVRVARHVPRFLSVLERCTCRSFLRELS